MPLLSTKRLSDERSPKRLGPVAADLLSHVVSVLEDDLSREAYGQIYTQILYRVLEASYAKATSIRGGKEAYRIYLRRVFTKNKTEKRGAGRHK